MPAPMMPPTPIAVSCHRPSVRDRSVARSSAMSSTGLRRKIPDPRPNRCGAAVLAASSGYATPFGVPRGDLDRIQRG